LSQNAEVFGLPIYDEYDDYSEFDFQEQLASLENDLFQQSDRSCQPIYHSCDIEHEESCELVEGNSSPLFFSSFKLLR